MILHGHGHEAVKNKELTEMGSLAAGIAERVRQEEKNLTIVNSIRNVPRHIAIGVSCKLM